MGSYRKLGLPGDSIISEVDATKLITGSCAKSATIAIRSGGSVKDYPAAAKPHPEFLDAAYCTAIKPEHVRVDRNMCAYRGKIVNFGHRYVYLCTAVDKLARINALAKPRSNPEPPKTEAKTYHDKRKSFGERLASWLNSD